MPADWKPLNKHVKKLKLIIDTLNDSKTVQSLDLEVTNTNLWASETRNSP